MRPPRPSWLAAALDALLPPACAGCDRAAPPGRAFCPRCESGLPLVAPGACPRCQMHPSPASGRCGASPPEDPLDAAIAATWLEPPVSEWIHAFKYPARGMRGLAPGPTAAIADLAARAARLIALPPPDLVVPVPLHPRRLRGRGFNPALAVARAAAGAVDAPVAPTALERLRDTASQTGLDAAARRRNVRGAMRARHTVPARIWLADDVITTGATAREAARALLCAGARSVVALAVARAPLDGPRGSDRGRPRGPAQTSWVRWIGGPR